MERQPSSSLSQEEQLEIELTEMLSGVDSEMSDVSEQCIYKVPQKIRQVNSKAYTPSVVTIGPFHKPRDFNGENNNLKPMENVKLKYLERFLNRTKQLSMRDLILSLIEKERRLRSCYARPIDFNSNNFLTMILVDACFVIEHFLRVYTGLDLIETDPLSRSWLSDDVIQDLTLLENQLPFVVLEDIFDSAKRRGMKVEFPFKDAEFVGPVTDAKSLTFLVITFHYFRNFNNHFNIKPADIKRPKHFTDLLRTFVQPSPIPSGNLKPSDRVKHLQSASQLSEAGLVFKVSPRKCWFDIKYDHQRGVMEMPSLIVDDDTERLFRNILVFEQCHCPHSPIVTQYLFFLDFLINTDKDVNILVDKKIIVNWMGDANVVAKMFNSLCSNINVTFISEEYCSLHDDLIKFYENPCNKYKTIFYHEYFNTPWKKASTTAAVLLLLLTLAQTVMFDHLRLYYRWEEDWESLDLCGHLMYNVGT